MPVSLPAGSLGRDNGLGGGTMVAVPRGVVGLFGGGTVPKKKKDVHKCYNHKMYKKGENAEVAHSEHD